MHVEPHVWVSAAVYAVYSVVCTFIDNLGMAGLHELVLNDNRITSVPECKLSAMFV